MTTRSRATTEVKATAGHAVTGILQAALEHLGHSDLMHRVLHADVALHVTDRALTITITPEATDDNPGT